MADVAIPTQKRCTKCAVIKPLEAFHPHKLGRYGRHPNCRECRSSRGGVDAYLASGARDVEDGHVWRPVLGWEGYYAASDDGRIRSIDRMIDLPNGRKRLQLGRVLRSYIGQNGYPYVRLSRDGKTSLKTVHSLVAEAFHGARPKGCDVAHIDGNEGNAAPDNLRWATKAENMADKVRHGTDHRGENGPAARLTREDVAIIRNDTSIPAKDMAARFKISHWNVYKIRSGRSWVRSLQNVRRKPLRANYISARLREEVQRRDPQQCHYCGATDTMLHFDHRVPLSRGGTTSLDNLVLACCRCNCAKGAMTAEEFLQRRN